MMRLHWRKHSILISVFVLALVAPLPGSTGDEDESKREAEMARIQSLMDEGDWKAAGKALKSYGRKYAKTDEEKAEVESLRLLAEGEIELALIQKKYVKKQHHRKTANQLSGFIEKYGQHEELRARAEEVLNAARSAYVLVIEDFEDEESFDDGEVLDTAPRGKSIVTDPKRVKQGRKAGRWKTGMGWDSWLFDSPKADWSEYDFFCMWVFNPKVNDPMAHLEIEPHTGGYHYFQYWLAIDWVGWKSIRVPLKGRASKFGKHGNADWAMIERLWFDKDEGRGAPFDLIFDDIRLEKATK